MQSNQIKAFYCIKKGKKKLYRHATEGEKGITAKDAVFVKHKKVVSTFPLKHLNQI